MLAKLMQLSAAERLVANTFQSVVPASPVGAALEGYFGYKNMAEAQERARKDEERKDFVFDLQVKQAQREEANRQRQEELRQEAADIIQSSISGDTAPGDILGHFAAGGNPQMMAIAAQINAAAAQQQQAELALQFGNVADEYDTLNKDKGAPHPSRGPGGFSPAKMQELALLQEQGQGIYDGVAEASRRAAQSQQIAGLLGGGGGKHKAISLGDGKVFMYNENTGEGNVIGSGGGKSSEGEGKNWGVTVGIEQTEGAPMSAEEARDTFFEEGGNISFLTQMSQLRKKSRERADDMEADLDAFTANNDVLGILSAREAVTYAAVQQWERMMKGNNGKIFAGDAENFIANYKSALKAAAAGMGTNVDKLAYEKALSFEGDIVDRGIDAVLQSVFGEVPGEQPENILQKLKDEHKLMVAARDKAGAGQLNAFRTKMASLPLYIEVRGKDGKIKRVEVTEKQRLANANRNISRLMTANNPALNRDLDYFAASPEGEAAKKKAPDFVEQNVTGGDSPVKVAKGLAAMSAEQRAAFIENKQGDKELARADNTAKRFALAAQEKFDKTGEAEISADVIEQVKAAYIDAAVVYAGVDLPPEAMDAALGGKTPTHYVMDDYNGKWVDQNGKPYKVGALPKHFTDFLEDIDDIDNDGVKDDFQIIQYFAEGKGFRGALVSIGIASPLDFPKGNAVLLFPEAAIDMLGEVAKMKKTDPAHKVAARKKMEAALSLIEAYRAAQGGGGAPSNLLKILPMAVPGSGAIANGSAAAAGKPKS